MTTFCLVHWMSVAGYCVSFVKCVEKQKPQRLLDPSRKPVPLNNLHLKYPVQASLELLAQTLLAPSLGALVLLHDL